MEDQVQLADILETTVQSFYKYLRVCVGVHVCVGGWVCVHVCVGVRVGRSGPDDTSLCRLHYDTLHLNEVEYS